jgi:hypothetical protein
MSDDVDTAKLPPPSAMGAFEISPEDVTRRAAWIGHLRTRLLQSRVPEPLWNGLLLYLTERKPPGHFLMAVLMNDLKDACARADEINRAHLYDVVYFLYNYAPEACWGSADRVDRWLAASEPPPVRLLA